ncbi:hypothetical protein [Synechococcus sp. NOUM97013]|uniref:hypothetical protein n=1 Tax=Synechococcus sp. NOUM97013 TaxID=1442555 RepID=UPI001645F296|nr:hypothetical protein [Synechococcus sp. NOUM97013]QNI72725.1 putative conserved membrane protein [Synechococcus sp. NOUM97013]
MKNAIFRKLSAGPSQVPKYEQGIALVLSLMMGMVLISGVTGLLLRQLMARKLGASESYQQMAEAAALNGFNRILGDLNTNESTLYKGYLFTLDHHSGDESTAGSERWGWNASNEANFPLRELCTDRSQMPEAVPGSSSSSNPPYIALTESSSSQRDDGQENIQLHYRLRGYTTTATASNNGLGEGRFQVEGLVVRDGDDPKTGYLARTLLLRSLYVSSIVAGDGDWAVLAGQNLWLGDTQIQTRNGDDGDGKILLNVNSADYYLTGNGCINLLDDIHATDNTNLEGRVIPILEKGLPTGSLWNQGLTKDTEDGSDEIRIWSFDDTETFEQCTAIACSRDSNIEELTGRSDLQDNNENGATVRLSSNELCGGTGEDCHIFVEHINLSDTRLLIETSAERPIVLHLEYPNTTTKEPLETGITGSINLADGSQLCGVDAGSFECNEKPEQLVILSTVPKPARLSTCEISPQNEPYVLAFEGNSLPYATVHLIPGVVKTGPMATTLNGLIWADGICTNAGPFSLISETKANSSVVRDLNSQWGWEDQNFPGYGKMVTRGIRGTGLDTFRRW